MKKCVKIIIVLCLSFMVLSGCSTESANIPEPPMVKKDIKLKIMTTNYLIYDMVENIVKDKQNVDFMFKYEKDQWDFTFTDDSVNNISRQDLFIYTGADYEPWMNDFLDAMNKSNVTILNISRGTTIISRDDPIKYKYDDKERDIKDNPYYWLDPDKYKTALFNIAKAIEDKDPQNKKFYDDNFQAQVKKIDTYEKRLKDISKKLKDYTFVVQGDRLDYFTKFNGFKVIKLPTDFYMNSPESDARKSIEDKLSKAGNCIFLYDSKQELNDNEDLINTYKMKYSQVTVYKYKTQYTDLIEGNCVGLEDLEGSK